MTNIPEFDQEKFFLGSLCKRNHNFFDGHSLRRLKCRTCLECERENERRNRPRQGRKQREIISANGNYLGKLCKKGHDYRGSGKSLRTSTRHCVECLKQANRDYPKTENGKRSSLLRGQRYRSGETYRERLRRRRKYEPCEKVVVDCQHYLGRLCLRKHDFNGSGRSLRYIASRECVQCSSEMNALWRTQNQEYRRQYFSDRSEIDKLVKRQWVDRNPEKVKAIQKRFRQSDKGKILNRRRRDRRRARIASAHRVSYTREQVLNLFNAFDKCCAWCGQTIEISANGTLDHFIPISRGGADCLGNLIPSCLKCNVSKNASDPKKWYELQSFYSKRRWSKILRILGKTDITYTQIPLL